MWSRDAISARNFSDLQETVFYIHCNSLLMFALLINNTNFEVSSLILESKLWIKLLFVRMTVEGIPLPLILRTKRKLLSAVMAGDFHCFHKKKQKTKNRKLSSMHESVVCLQVWFTAIPVFQRIDYLHSINEICPKTLRLLWSWINTAVLVHLNSSSYLFLKPNEHSWDEDGCRKEDSTERQSALLCSYVYIDPSM